MGPEIGDAAGPILYITTTHPGAQEGVPYATGSKEVGPGLL